MTQTHTRPHAGTARDFHHTHRSPIGPLLLTSDGTALTRLHMEESNHPVKPEPDWVGDAAPFRAATLQLDEYLAGDRRTFDLPLALRGTPFQRKVWTALQEIPWGRTASYADIARRVGPRRACGP